MEWLNQLTPQQRAVANKVAAEADKQGVPRELALAAAMQESKFNPKAKSKTGPVGVMQLSKAAASDQGVNRHNLDQNIRGGVGYLKQLLNQQQGDPQRALIAYHDGPSSPFFKGGSMSPEAYNHLQKVKAYGGFQGDIIPMATNAPTKMSIADIEPVPDIPMFTMGETVGRPRDARDVAAGVAGAGLGAKFGQNVMPSHREQQLLQAERRLNLLESKNAIDAANAAKVRTFGGDVANWHPGQYREDISRNIINPSSQADAAEQARQLEARAKAAQQFGQTVQAGPESRIQIPVDAGSGPRGGPGKTAMPTSVIPEAPVPPAAGEAKPFLRSARFPGGGALNVLGGAGAAAQLYDAYERAKEGDIPGAALGAVSGLGGAVGTFFPNPVVQAIGGGVGLAGAGAQYLYDKYREEQEAKKQQAAKPNMAEGGLARLPKFAGRNESLVNVGKAAVKKGEQLVGRGSSGSVLDVPLSNRYPVTAPPVLAVDKKTGKEFLQKQNSPEAMMVESIRKQAQKDIDAGRYTPFFNVENRFHVDPANYPLTGSTITQAMPKKQATIDKWRAEFDTPEVRNRLLEAFNKAKGDPLTWNWYAMGQLENEYVKRLGPEAGRKAFRQAFAEPMAATTGGADPTSNLLMSYYGNFLKQQGMPMPSAAYEMPYPIGGRYASGNMAMYDKVMNQGAGLTPATPKRFNFSSNFMGHMDRPTIDEQMSGLYKPGMVVPPGDSYGITEQVLNDVARQQGVSPVNFQEVAWAGAKGTKGKPMIQHVNEAIERTSRVTGMTPDEVVERSLVHRTSPLYGGAAGVGLGASQSGMEEKSKGGLIGLPKFAGRGESLVQAGTAVAKKLLPQSERKANLQKFLLPSQEQRRMYHGSQNDINKFNPNNRITFLTPEPKFANSFATKSMDATEGQSLGPNPVIKPGANVMPVHVQAENIFDPTNEQHIHALRKQMLSNYDQYGGHDGPKYIDRLISYARTEAPFDNWEAMENPNIQNAIRDLGHDAFRVREAGVENLGVYDPRRIKSAIGNEGTYNTRDLDVTKAEGGLVHLQSGGNPKAQIAKRLLGSTYDMLGLTPESVAAWRKANAKPYKQQQDPVLAKALDAYLTKQISQEDYLRIMNERRPIRPLMAVPGSHSNADIASALDQTKAEKGILGLNLQVPEGTRVGNRLDIPAYERYGVYVDTMHDPAGKPIGYGHTGHLKDVEFKSSPTRAARVGLGTKEQGLTPLAAAEGQGKSPFAMMVGNQVNTSDDEVRRMLQDYLRDPEWHQIGMNPYRGSQFYDKADMMPVWSAKEKIQAGPLVLARDIEKSDWTDPRLMTEFGVNYKRGGKV